MEDQNNFNIGSDGLLDTINFRFDELRGFDNLCHVLKAWNLIYLSRKIFPLSLKKHESLAN